MHHPWVPATWPSRVSGVVGGGNGNQSVTSAVLGTLPETEGAFVLPATIYAYGRPQELSFAQPYLQLYYWLDAIDQLGRSMWWESGEGGGGGGGKYH